MQQIRNILVGVDFSPGSEVAIDWAVRLARNAESRLHVVHVIDKSAIGEVARSTGALESSMRDFLTREMIQCLEQATAGLDLPQAVDWEVRVGAPIQEIATVSRMVSADLVVLGCRGRADDGVGSLATRSAALVPASVLLVPSPAPAAATTVVACVDLSPVSGTVLQEAARLARIESAALKVLHVNRLPWFNLNSVRRADSKGSSNLPRIQRLVQDVGLDACGVPWELVTREHTDPSFEVLSSLEKVKPDLVVLGVSGRSGFRHLLLGSTAERVIRREFSPVLMVKHHERESTQEEKP